MGTIVNLFPKCQSFVFILVECKGHLDKMSAGWFYNVRLVPNGTLEMWLHCRVDLWESKMFLKICQGVRRERSAMRREQRSLWSKILMMNDLCHTSQIHPTWIWIGFCRWIDERHVSIGKVGNVNQLDENGLDELRPEHSTKDVFDFVYADFEARSYLALATWTRYTQKSLDIAIVVLKNMSVSNINILSKNHD